MFWHATIMKVKSNDSFKILQWNARSLSSNLLSFEHYVQEGNYSVLALQSLNVERHRLPNLENYFYPPLYSINDANKKVQSALYIKCNLEYTQIVPFPVPQENKGIFTTGAEIKVNKDTLYNVLSVYYPSGPKEDNTDWIKNADLTKKKWIIVGDFNAHAPFWDSECSKVSCNRFVENIIDSCLILLNDGRITRIPDISTHKPSAIDLSLVSPSLAVKCKWFTEDDCLGSDHLPITIVFNDDINNEVTDIEDKIPKFNYKLANWDAFQAYLALYDTSFVDNDDVNLVHTNFCKVVLLAAVLSIPKRKF